jgi:hypothetical protein
VFPQHLRTWGRPQITDASLFQIVVNYTDEIAIIAAAALHSVLMARSPSVTRAMSGMQGLTGVLSPQRGTFSDEMQRRAFEVEHCEHRPTWPACPTRPVQTARREGHGIPLGRLRSRRAARTAALPVCSCCGLCALAASKIHPPAFVTAPILQSSGAVMRLGRPCLVGATQVAPTPRFDLEKSSDLMGASFTARASRTPSKRKLALVASWYGSVACAKTESPNPAYSDGKRVSKSGCSHVTPARSDLRRPIRYGW